MYGDEYDISRFQSSQGAQENLSDLEESWGRKFKSFGEHWNGERQLYRFFYDDFKVFYHSFEQLRYNKVKSITEDSFEIKFSSVSVCNLYNHGKKCVDLIKELKLVSGLSKEEKGFIKKFSETRNKFFDHNFNPNGYRYYFEPNLWSLLDTRSFLEIRVHGNNEHEYDVLIDYYEDYYNLEGILVKIIKGF